MKFSQMQYERPDLQELTQGYEQVTQAFLNARSASEQMDCILRHEEMMAQYQTMSTLAFIRHSIHTADEFYEQEHRFFNEASPELQAYVQQFQQAVVQSKFRRELEKDLGKLFFRDMELSLKTFSPEIMDLLKEENNLTTEYEKLLASAKIPWDGQELNLSSIIKYQQSGERRVRKQAWQKTAEFFSEHAGQLDELFDRLVKNRDEQAKTLGYANFIGLAYDRLGRNCYQPDEVKIFREQIVKDLVPVTEKMREHQAQRVGLPHVGFVDVNTYFPDGNPKPKGDTAALVQAAQKMYDEMGSVTGEFFRFMRENELFDLESKPNKQGGGYCTELTRYQCPFIFSNFNGTLGDVDVLTHEAGHALESYLLREVKIRENAQCTMETAEVHSMSMELFARPWSHLFFGEDTQKFHTYQLESALNFIPYGCMVDEFQHVVYAKPELSPKERKDVWLELEKKYRPWLDFEDLEFFRDGGGYQRQHHIYSFPFYYIDYCLAQTVALEFWSASKKDWNKAFDRYLAFLRASGDHTFVQVVEQAGLKLPFRPNCLEGLSREILDGAI